MSLKINERTDDMKKKISIVTLVIIIIAISLVISIYIPNKDKLKKNIEEDKSVSYYLLKRDENFGVINQNGDIIIEPQYEDITIPNPHKAVFICEKDGKHKVLNEKNNEIYNKYNNVEAIELSNIITESAYEKRVLKYSKDGKYGILGIDGNVIIEPKYEDVSSLGYKEGEILVKENGNYGIIDDQGNTIIKSNYTSIVSDQYFNTEDGYKKSGYIVGITTNEGYRYGYIDYEGGKVLDTEYNQILRLNDVKSNKDIYLLAAKNGQYGAFINNNKIINTQYQSITYDCGTGTYIVERTGQYGAINEKGIEILKVEYTDIQVNGIYMYTKKGEEEQKVFDKNGKEIDISFNTIITATDNQEYFIKTVQDKENEYSTILNSKLEEISKQKYKAIEYAYDKYFIVTNNESKNLLIDVDEKVIIEPNFDMIQKLKGKNIIQTLNFETNTTQIYNEEFKKTVEIKDANLQMLDDYIKIYNDEEEYYIDNTGNVITDQDRIDKIKKSNAVLKIKNFKRVTYGVEQYYYIENNV